LLVHRYSRLIYSIPFKWGLQREDAKEIFQSVWLDCFQELHSLRDIDRLQAWLVRIAIRKCYRFSTSKRSRPEDVEIVETDHASEDPSEGLATLLWLACLSGPALSPNWTGQHRPFSTAAISAVAGSIGCRWRLA